MDSIWNAIIGNLPAIITGLLAIGVIATYGRKLSSLLVQLGELFSAANAILDGATPEEIEKLKKEYKDVEAAWKELIGKK